VGDADSRREVAQLGRKAVLGKVTDCGGHDLAFAYRDR
jgi:hypothetical protein